MTVAAAGKYTTACHFVQSSVAADTTVAAVATAGKYTTAAVAASSSAVD